MSIRRAVRRGETGGEVCVEVVEVVGLEDGCCVVIAAGRCEGGEIGEVEREDSCNVRVRRGRGAGRVGSVETVESWIDSVGCGVGAVGSGMGEIGAVATAVLIIWRESAARDDDSFACTAGAGDVGKVAAAVLWSCMFNFADAEVVEGCDNWDAALVPFGEDSVRSGDSEFISIGEALCSGNWNGGEIDRVVGAWSTGRCLGCHASPSSCVGRGGVVVGLATHKPAEVPAGNVGIRDRDGTRGKGGGGEDASGAGTCFPSGIR